MDSIVKDRLIRRDTPLTTGMQVEVRVETVYTLDVKEWLDGEPSVTVEQIEADLKHAHRNIHAALIHYGYESEYADDSWYMQLPAAVICTCIGSNPHAGDCPARWEGRSSTRGSSRRTSRSSASGALVTTGIRPSTSSLSGCPHDPLG